MNRPPRLQHTEAVKTKQNASGPLGLGPATTSIADMLGLGQPASAASISAYGRNARLRAMPGAPQGCPQRRPRRSASSKPSPVRQCGRKSAREGVAGRRRVDHRDGPRGRTVFAAPPSRPRPRRPASRPCRADGARPRWAARSARSPERPRPLARSAASCSFMISTSRFEGSCPRLRPRARDSAPRARRAPGPSGPRARPPHRAPRAAA